MLTLCYPYEPMMGLEPMTSSLPRKCSTAELHRLLCLQSNPRQFTNLWVDGASILKHVMSGRRASNPQPIAWKAIALPIELLPLCVGGEGFEPSKPKQRIYSPSHLTALESPQFLWSPLPGSNQRPTDYK